MKRRNGNRRIPLAIGSGIILLCLVVMLLCARWYETRNIQPETRGDYRQRYAYDNIIEVNGKAYRQRKELTTLLLMGIDRDSDEEITGFRSGGQADFMRVIIIDPKEDAIHQLAIDRDTMTPITVLGILGDVSNIRTLQICLSHSYGDGKAQSCEHAVEAVSNLLLGVDIDNYFAMNLEGVSALNDWAGGVTVTLEDDFSYADPRMQKGSTITLMGDQAELFVRGRRSVSDGTNQSRMKRQQVYLHSFSEKVGDKLKQSKDEIRNLYDVLEPYQCTDLSRGQIINEGWSAREYTLTEPVEIPGIHKIGDDGYMEFHVDEDGLQRIVLDMFYEAI